MLEAATLEVIACPLCKGKLVYDKKNQELICRFDQLAYPICHGIPVMMIDDARKIDV